jgi:hypothetical protein
MNRRQLIPNEIGDWLAYDPLTGLFWWKKNLGRKIKAGTMCGVPRGYHITIGFQRRRYLAHRLAWVLVTGQQPPSVIDHKDADGRNNRWANLRAATDALNGANRRRQGTHSKGTHNLKGRWQAHIRVNGKKLHLGSFGTEEEAHAAYVKAAIEHFGEFARAA